MVTHAACFWRTVLLLIFMFAVCYIAYIGGELLLVPACVTSLELNFTRGCNGDVELCDRLYSEVCYATMHNAYATTQNGIVVAQHRVCLRNALVGGIRSFMLDVHLTSQNELKLCHVSCATGAVSLAVTLETFREFLELNPREIVTLHLELGYDMRFDEGAVPDADMVRLKTLLAAAYADAGLLRFVYEYSFYWPTLEVMVIANTRLVTFSKELYAANITYHLWDLSYNDFVAQTPWDSTDTQQLRANCALPNMVYYWQEHTVIVLNHFTTLGAAGVNMASTSALGDALGIDALRGINRSPWMEEHLATCAKCLGRFPNFIAVDLWQSSDVIQVVAAFNAVPLTARAACFKQNDSFCASP